LSDSDESNLVDSSEAKQQKEILENTGEINK
jgi:hypothetical protein